MSTIDTVGIYLTEDERGHLLRICDDLENREKAALRIQEGPEAQTYAAEQAAIRKLMTLPAALAADRERMRSVVMQIMENAARSAEIIDDCRPYDIAYSGRIASRVADQLATARAGLSILDRAELDSLLGYLVEERDVAYDDGRSSDARAYRDWHAALSKLLGIP